MTALNFLMFVGIVPYPLKCTLGHVWGLFQTSTHSCTLECKTRLTESVTDPTTKKKVTKQTCCRAEKQSWRGYDASLVGHDNWSNRFGPPETAKLLYWYSQRQTIEEICERTALKPKAVGKACDVIREKLVKHIVGLQMEDPELLGRGKHQGPGGLHLRDQEEESPVPGQND